MNEDEVVSQLQVPAGLRLMRAGMAKMSEVSWFDVGLKSGLVALYVTIIWAAWTTGALLDPFSQVYESRIGAVLMTLGGAYSVLMLVVTGVRAVM
ncbi:MAG TPA: hypothetical protein VHI52_07455, partial [Verrucomicrobiae bacterium]|nr:hypothetical protein [Verrucomicrobiae bacterium]